jgi:hypothetical protein
MSGKNLERNKSPDICDNDNQRRFLCTRTMKHKGLKAYETQGSALEGAKREGHRDVQQSDKTVTGSNNQKRKRHQNVHRQIGLLLGATFKRGRDTEMSKVG